MDITHKLKATGLILQQRNFAYVVSLCLIFICGVLAVKVLMQQERIIVIPNMNESEKQYVMDGDHIPPEYLQDWAFKLLGDLFTANPKTVRTKNKRFLEWAMSSSALDSDLEATAKALRVDNISTAFYPEEHKIYYGKKEIHVEGRFLTFFGKSKTPVLSKRTFVLGWSIMPGGVLGIRDLKQIQKTSPS